MARCVFIFRKEERPPVWWVAANRWNKQSWTAKIVGLPAWGLGEVLTIPQTKNEFCCEAVNG
jgi:hypothetical protein